MTEQGPWRNGKVHVLDEKCATCIFRPGNLMHLREGTVESMVQQCRDNESAIPCHKTLDGPKAICRGFYDVHHSEILTLRLAQAMDVLVFTPLTEEQH